MVGYVVVLLWSGCTAGPVCSAVLVSCRSAFPRASGGHRGLHLTGPCKAELVTPIVPQQAHPFSVLLSLHCHPTPQYSSRHGDEPDVPLPVNGIRSLTLRAGDCRAGAHVTTRAKWTFLHSFLSKALCWHNNLPPTSTYYVGITFQHLNDHAVIYCRNNSLFQDARYAQHVKDGEQCLHHVFFVRVMHVYTQQVSYKVYFMQFQHKSRWIMSSVKCE